MNIAYYLGRMQQGLREKIEAEPIYATWVKQGFRLEQIGSEPAVMATLYNELSVRERNILLAIVANIGCEPFDWAKLQSCTAASMSGAEAKVGFLMLLAKGLLFTFRKSWGERVYVMAHDSMALWQRILWADDSRIKVIHSGADEADKVGQVGHAGPTAKAVQTIEFIEEGGIGLGEAIFQSMVYISQQQLKLGKNGALHKRQLQKWVELLQISDERLSAIRIVYAYTKEYPTSLAIVLDVLARLQIVELGAEELVLQQDAAKGWLLMSEAEQNKCLYSLWKQVVFPAECWLQHAILLLERQPGNSWICPEGIMEWLRLNGLINQESDAGDAARIKQLEEQWLLPLLAFGWLDRGSSNEKGSLMSRYRWRAYPLATDSLLNMWEVGLEESKEQEIESRLEVGLPASEGCGGNFYVQPDFEVLVPPTTPPAIRWELAAMADHRYSDCMSMYILSRASLTRGMESGRGIDDMIAFLERHALYGIPDNVKLTLEQWAKPFGKVQIEKVILLRCEDETIAASIGKLPDAAECLIEPVGVQAWLVRAERLPTLTKILDKAGWIPGKLVIKDGSENSPKEQPQSLVIDTTKMLEFIKVHRQKVLEPKVHKPQVQGFIYARQPFLHFEMDQQLPVIEDIYPNINHVPTAWFKEYRIYHPTTRKEIIETAMGWSTCIQIRSYGIDRTVAPRKISETRGIWSLIGLEEPQYQEICLLPEEWQEMRIILPGLYEKY
ncbi:helicase-associated domain-containing protein [Paenibacillus agricola]|uniref:Helicase XPB/Ssl2 N-terminal domain-containing protein n=1 Tax=Paenibacillus agricola TaxID=2716264 RepID=A0ABX0IZA5_9BACL|nr:helicase-associated domain-containing protein [Paenibacillus agricola]NHN28471.1 hypothetical protein [Paenibacillus agricola]